MAKSHTGHSVVEIRPEDSTPGSSSYNIHSLPQEVIALEELANRTSLSNTHEDDPRFTGFTTSTSLGDRDTSTVRRRSAVLPISNSPATRPTWVQHSSCRAKQRLNSLLNIPGISHIVRWIEGPSLVKQYRIIPYLPKLQAWPSTLLSKHLSPTSGAASVAIVICLLWLIAFIAVSTNFKKTTIAEATTDAPIRLSCIATLWDDSCGLDNRFCQPLKGSSFPFHCPSGCATVQILNPYVVGDQQINYRNLVIGGPNSDNGSTSIYRGDSFICQAAVHAGVISNTYGGCGILSREGAHAGFASTDRNGISSIAFQPSFPLSFSFTSSSDDCRDPQWYLLVLSVLATIGISIIATPPVLFISSIFTIVFFQVALVSDPPWSSDYSGVVSTAIGRFLPAAFVIAIVFQSSIVRTLRGLKAHWEQTFLWLGGCWVGALNAYTFDRIPLSRLFGYDLRQQPGAIVALIIIVLVLFAAALGQIWVFRKEGRLLGLLRFYIPTAAVLGCLAGAPGLDIRLHHYIIALLLLPGTAIQTRPSLLYQGVLVGLFINGIARWGFASILQQTTQLLTGAETGSDLPTGLVPSIVNDTIKFTINQITEGFDGISIRVNDVEHFQLTNASLPVVLNWTRTAVNEPSFFRFAFTGTYAIGGLWYGDYTKPGTWFANGTWKEMAPGPS